MREKMSVVGRREVMYVGCRHTAGDKMCKIQQIGSQETKGEA
jgi:hypothetical protein